MTISSAVWIQSTNVTDRRNPGHSKDRADAMRLRIASRGNKCHCDCRLRLASQQPMTCYVIVTLMTFDTQSNGRRIEVKSQL